MGRICLIICLLFLTVSRLSAQTGGTANLEFVENKGQWDPAVKFRAQIPTGAFSLGSKGFSVMMHDTGDLRRLKDAMHGNLRASGVSSASRAGKASGGPNVLHSHVYQVSFENASEGVEIIPEKALPTYNNYFIGNDPTKWAGNCKVYQGIVYKNIYEGIDLHYYTNGGVLKYDLIVHPGADPGKITMKYKGQDQLSLKKNQVYVKTSVGVVREWIPRSYQYNGEEKKDMQCSYQLTEGNKIKFKVKNYSPDATLIIDPTEVFCSFTGSTSDNWGYTATYDGSGNFYAGGIVLNDPQGNSTGDGFPQTAGSYQRTFQGGDGSDGNYMYDVAIIKFNSTGSSRLYSTYLGGHGDEQPHSMVVDNNGELIVAGRTSSTDFPNYPASTMQTYGEGGGYDIFLTKFNATGSGLIGSRRIGGKGDDGVNYKPKYAEEGTKLLRLNYGDDGRSEVILDGAGNVYLASCTQSVPPNFSAALDLFPTTAGSFQPNPGGGGQDGVVLATSPDLSTILFSSFVGGSDVDAAFVLALSPITNNLYVGGGTMSSDLQGVVGGKAVYGANQGGIDGFVTEVTPNGATQLATSYFGAPGNNTTDIIYGLDVDRFGYPYITGSTTGAWPIVNVGATGFAQPGGKQFISKLQPDLSAWVYSTAFGKTGSPFPDISTTAFLVDRCENVYVAGWGGGIDPQEGYNNSGTTGLPVTANAIRGTTDGQDFYFFVLQRDAVKQLYGSFFGQVNGQLGDHVDGGTSRFDRQGIIYEAICANCYGGANFPTTAGAWATRNGTTSGGQVLGCNEAAVKIAFNFAGVETGVKASLTGRGDSLGCIPLKAFLQDTIHNAKTWVWSFGDGSPDTVTTVRSVTHTYTAVGTYRVILVAIDSTTCNISDTAYMNITARDDRASLNFNYTKIGPCTSNDYNFNNFSTAPPGKPFGDSSFAWNFGDNTPPPPASGLGLTEHSFASPGTYPVSLILIDTNYCDYPDTLTRLLSVAQNVKAQIVTPANGCVPYTAVINNASVAGQQFYWDFGDGSPIDSADRTPPPHLYADTGVYTIKLRVVDSSTCNITDATQFTITVHSKPTAAFTVQPGPPLANTPTDFTNTSSNDGIRYTWLFGDGFFEIKNNKDSAVHQYNKTGSFQACLVSLNAFGCADTACQPVQALINPLLDVPNAFTPGRFGENGIVKVVGFGITRMTFRIYNRWGQLVFQSINQADGWDGTFSGTPQAMDVYAYTLEAEYFDGTRVTKKGNITLIR